MKDFYQEKIEEIKKLISLNKKLALEKLQEELKMPYIPEKYEIQFLEILQDLNLNLIKKPIQNSLSQKEIIKFLNSKDKIKEAIAINSLNNQNLRKIVKDLKTWLEKQGNDIIGKAFVYEALVSQDIDVDLNINNVLINPQKDKSFFNDIEIDKAFKSIENLTSKNPELQNSTEEQLKLYALSIFPQKIIDGNKIAQNIFHVVEFMFDENIILSGEEKLIYNILKK